MRGDLQSVWDETYREIWNPLFEREGVPDDVFSELYRELWMALKEPTGDDALNIPLGDAVQLREAFGRAISLSAVEVEREQADDAFTRARIAEEADLIRRRGLAEESLSNLLGQEVDARALLTEALFQLASDENRRAEARGRTLESTVNDRREARSAFEQVRGFNLTGERALVAFLENAFDVIDDLGGDALSNQYFSLLVAFIEKFSLRYDLRRPCTLCPTLPGMFASLVRDMRMHASQDPHLDALMKDFEGALRDLRLDCSEGRIKTCIQKQMNLLEAVGRSFPGVTGTTLGVICDQVGTWPHEKLKEAMKDLYRFASDYPGIRHGGTPANAIRAVDMRDMVAMSVLLAGFAPYLSNQIVPDLVYRGS